VWADQSPNHADAKQSIISLRPKLAAPIGAAPNMLEFDGIDDQLALPEGFSGLQSGLERVRDRARNRGRQLPQLAPVSTSPSTDDIDIGRLDGSIHYEVQDEDTSGTTNVRIEPDRAPERDPSAQ